MEAIDGSELAYAGRPAISAPKPRLINDRSAARVLGVGRSTVWKLMAEQKLDARKLGRKTLITAESLEAYLASLPKAEIRLGRKAA